MALRTPLSVTPHLYMGDSTGRPLDMGTVYFGEQDKDPEFYPIDLFSDDALTLPLAQPVHTKGGYLYDKGDMVEPHAKEIIYSVKVLDSYGRKVFYKGAMMRNSWNDDVIEQINAAIVASTELARQVATDITNEAINNTAIEGGVLADTFVTVTANGVGTVARTQRDKNSERISIKDFGAIGDGILHTVAEWTVVGSKVYYPDLAAIQADYPHVTSLTDSIDWAATQQAIKSLPLNIDDGDIQNFKGFPTGGVIHVPRGMYTLNRKVNMQRGLRLIGEGRESAQFISYIANDSVFQYADVGRYIQDEIVIHNMSIWQHDSVVATAGAAIDVIDGPTSVLSLYLNVDNVYIEKTFYGIRHMSGVGGGVRNSNIARTESHGIYLTGIYSTTSMAFENTYVHGCKGDGYHIEKAAYIAFIACASDSNTGNGYVIKNTRGYELVACGAEVNKKAAAVLQTTGGGVVNLMAIANLEGAVKLVSNTGLVRFNGGDWEGEGTAIRTTGLSQVHIDGTVMAGDYATQRSDTQAFLRDESSNAAGKLVGGTKNQWLIGGSNQPQPDGGFAVGGTADAATIYGLKVNQQFTTAGSARNSALFTQFTCVANTASYNLALGMFVLDAFVGEGATLKRTAGIAIKEQTKGTEANANILIDAGQNTVPAGEWSLYSGSTKPSYFAGALSFKPKSAATPTANGDVTFELTSDTLLKIKVKGSDGVVRSTSLILS